MDQTSFTVCALILAGAIIGLIITIFIDQRAKTRVKEAEEAKQMATERNRSLVEQLHEQMSKVRELSMELHSIDTKIPLFDTPRRFEIGRTKNHIYVLVIWRAQNRSYEVKAPLKEFPIDDDEEFAMLEAQELIDHLNEK